jgi:hypothetical protein
MISIEDFSDILTANVRLGKSLQKSQDLQRIERKGFRSQAREENAIEELGINIDKELKKYGKILGKKFKPTIVKKDGEFIGLLQITDPHFNELIDLPYNKYDFKVAARRLKKFVKHAKRIFKAYGITKVVLAVTGDLLNSDRRLDELLSQANNRGKACILSVHLLKQVILDLAHDFKLDIVSVLGNESRSDQEMTYGDHSLSNSYDFMIMAMLDQVLGELEGINFISYDTVETVVDIGGEGWSQKVFMSHDFSGQSNNQKNTQSTLGRISTQLRVIIDFIIAGHIHAMHNGDMSARSSSLAGSNAYSDKKLNLAGRASQNLIVFGKIDRLVIGVDLQNCDEDSYDIEEKLEAYNSKSVDKTKEQKTIFQITI